MLWNHNHSCRGDAQNCARTLMTNPNKRASVIGYEGTNFCRQVAILSLPQPKNLFSRKQSSPTLTSNTTSIPHWYVLMNLDSALSSTARRKYADHCCKKARYPSHFQNHGRRCWSPSSSYIQTCSCRRRWNWKGPSIQGEPQVTAQPSRRVGGEVTANAFLP